MAVAVIPLIVFGVLCLVLVPQHRESSTYGGNDAWTPMMWTDSTPDTSCHTTNGVVDCSGGDASCDGGGAGCDWLRTCPIPS
jgi:hypothetical protein